MNCRPDDPKLALVTNVLIDAWLSGGDGRPGYTIPAAPDQVAWERIDVILTSPDLTTIRCTVVNDDTTRLSSDHFPVIAEIGETI